MKKILIVLSELRMKKYYFIEVRIKTILIILTELQKKKYSLFYRGSDKEKKKLNPETLKGKNSLRYPPSRLPFVCVVVSSGKSSSNILLKKAVKLFCRLNRL